MHVQLIFNKPQKYFHGERMVLLTNDTETIAYHH